jgi:hypothetical protein
MSIYFNKSTTQQNLNSNELATIQLMQNALIEGVATEKLALFSQGNSNTFVLYDERLEINYTNPKKKRGELVIRNQNGVEVKRLAFQSRKGLTDLFTKYVTGKRDVNKLELQKYLSTPRDLQKLMTKPGFTALSFTFENQLFPFITGYGAKGFITATKHAAKELNHLQQRSEELVNYHNMRRIQFLGATLEIEKKDNGTGFLVWRIRDKEPIKLTFQTPEQMRSNVKELLTSRRLSVEDELREMRDFGKTALAFEEHVIDREVKLEFQIDKKTGLIMHNLTNFLKTNPVTSQLKSVPNFNVPDPAQYQNYLINLVGYFGNQLVTYSDDELEKLDGSFSSLGLINQLLIQLEHQADNLESEKFHFDSCVYEKQFPLVFGDVYMDIDRKKNGSGHINISIAGRKSAQQIPFKSEKEIPVILENVVRPFYQKYKQKIDTSIEKATKNSKDSNCDLSDIIKELKETDEQMRMRFIQSSSFKGIRPPVA